MAITTVDGARFGSSDNSSEEGFFARLFRRVTESQMRRAEAAIAYHLSAMSDEHLKALGYERKDLPKGGFLPLI